MVLVAAMVLMTAAQVVLVVTAARVVMAATVQVVTAGNHLAWSYIRM